MKINIVEQSQKLQNTIPFAVYKFVLNNYQMILGINIGIRMIKETIFLSISTKKMCIDLR